MQATLNLSFLRVNNESSLEYSKYIDLDQRFKRLKIKHLMNLNLDQYSYSFVDYPVYMNIHFYF
jgi:hypothetical protein